MDTFTMSVLALLCMIPAFAVVVVILEEDIIDRYILVQKYKAALKQKKHNDAQKQRASSIDG